MGERLIVPKRILTADPFIHQARLIESEWTEMETRIIKLNENWILGMLMDGREEDRVDPADLADPAGLAEDRIEMKVTTTKTKAGIAHAGQADIGIPTIEAQKKTEKREESLGRYQ